MIIQNRCVCACLLGLVSTACSPDHPPRLAWGMGVRTFDAAALGLGTTDAPDPWVAGIASATRLKVPTYDGSGQLVHPDMLVEPTPEVAIVGDDGRTHLFYVDLAATPTITQLVSLTAQPGTRRRRAASRSSRAASAPGTST